MDCVYCYHKLSCDGRVQLTSKLRKLSCIVMATENCSLADSLEKMHLPCRHKSVLPIGAVCVAEFCQKVESIEQEL